MKFNTRIQSLFLFYISFLHTSTLRFMIAGGGGNNVIFGVAAATAAAAATSTTVEIAPVEEEEEKVVVNPQIEEQKNEHAIETKKNEQKNETKNKNNLRSGRRPTTEGASTSEQEGQDRNLFWHIDGALTYGGRFHIRSGGGMVMERRMSGARGAGNQGVVNFHYENVFGSNDSYETGTVAKAYEWIPRSTATDNNDILDPKRWECVKYGDVIYLRNNFMESRWLTGGRSAGNRSVHTRDRNGSEYEREDAGKTYEWIVRSEFRPRPEDPEHGKCVKDGDWFYLEVNSKKDYYLWYEWGNVSTAYNKGFTRESRMKVRLCPVFGSCFD